MPTDADDLEWVDITDFTPGLTDSRAGGAIGAPDGAAQVMVNCTPGPNGIGLVGGPRRTYTINRAIGAVPYPPSGQEYHAVMDAMVGPLPVNDWNLNSGTTWQVSNAEASDTSKHPAEAEFAWCWQYYNLDPATGHVRVQGAQSYHLVPGALTTSFSGTGFNLVANSSPGGVGVTIHSSNRDYGYCTLATIPTSPKGGYGWVCVLHNKAQSAVSNSPFGVATTHGMHGRLFYHRGDKYNSSMTGLADEDGWVDWGGYAYTYTVTTGLNDGYEGYGDPLMVFSHQGRVVTVDAGANLVTGVVKESYGTYPSYGIFRGGAEVTYTNVQGAQGLAFSKPLGQMGDIGTAGSAKWTQYLGITEPLGGVVAMESLDSQTLFVLGNTGACRISGDLGSGPQVTFLPTIPGAQGRGTHVCKTPIGLVFGTNTGVWLWAGGALPELLSPTLPQDFWWSSDLDSWAYQQPKGRIACSWPYLFFPNGWMCYLPTRTWSRIDVTDLELAFLGETGFFGYDGGRHWSIHPNGDVYAAAGKMPNGATSPFLCAFSPQLEHSAWKWQSQPIMRSRYRYLSVREVNVTYSCTGTGTLLVGLQGEDVSPVQYTHTVGATTGTSTRTIRFEVSLDSPQFQLSLLWKGTTITDACRIHRISAGYRPAQSVQRY